MKVLILLINITSNLSIKSSNGVFNYTLGYFANGNTNTQYLTVSYRSNFPDLKEIKSVYSYDK